MKQTINDFFDSAIRAEKILHLGAMCMDDSWPNIASESFDYDADEVWAALGVAEPDDASEEEWAEAIRDEGKFGFLVKFSTPIPTRFYNGGHAYSWGFYTSFWIYDESFENACVRALKWQEEYIKQMRAKAVEDRKLNPQAKGD